MAEKTNTYEFQAETKKLLDIVINSLYTERDVFIRELISNSADALEKFRHESLTAENVFDEHLPLEITIDLDEKKKQLVITDTGIGMTGDELAHNLGTIAHSGSNTFLSELAEAARKDVSLIGQFGVGFYSAFRLPPVFGCKVAAGTAQRVMNGPLMGVARLPSPPVPDCIVVPR